jgi:hypothetical protein
MATLIPTGRRNSSGAPVTALSSVAANEQLRQQRQQSEKFKKDCMQVAINCTAAPLVFGAVLGCVYGTGVLEKSGVTPIDTTLSGNCTATFNGVAKEIGFGGNASDAVRLDDCPNGVLSKNGIPLSKNGTYPLPAKVTMPNGCVGDFTASLNDKGQPCVTATMGPKCGWAQERKDDGPQTVDFNPGNGTVLVTTGAGSVTVCAPDSSPVNATNSVPGLGSKRLLRTNSRINNGTGEEKMSLVG